MTNVIPNVQNLHRAAGHSRFRSAGQRHPACLLIDSNPQCPIEGAILDRFADVFRRDLFG
jgi:hypothetical protein